MGLAQLQQILARLYTDQEFLEKFLTEGAAFGEQLGLNRAEISQLNALSRNQLIVFAESLRHKRYHAVCKLLPRSVKLAPDACRNLFASFAKRQLPAGPSKHREDALNFVRFVRTQKPAELESLKAPPWLTELLAYEAISLQIDQPESRFHRLRLSFPVWDSEALEAGQIAHPTLCLWFRFGLRRPWWHMRFALPYLLR